MLEEVIKFRTVPEVGGGRAADSASSVLHKPQDQIRVCEPLPSVLEFRVQCAKVGLGSQGDKLLPNCAELCCSTRFCRGSAEVLWFCRGSAEVLWGGDG